MHDAASAYSTHESIRVGYTKVDTNNMVIRVSSGKFKGLAYYKLQHAADLASYICRLVKVCYDIQDVNN